MWSIDFEDRSFSEVLILKTVCDVCGFVSKATVDYVDRDVPIHIEGLPINAKPCDGSNGTADDGVYW